MRFAFHEGFQWRNEKERFFLKHCIKNSRCSYFGGSLDKVYKKYNEEHPEWHLRRYYTKELKLLDHIYHCIKRNTAKEILYKAGLDELAVSIDEIDELNTLAGKPSELYDGLPMKVLRSINCPEGSLLVNRHGTREFLKTLNVRFPELFKNKLNDAQCRYLHFLILGGLTFGEAGRLFESRRPALAGIWCRSQFDLFILREKREQKLKELCEIYGKIDPIYKNYIRNVKDITRDFNIHLLGVYLLREREKYDKAIRRSNRKRDYDWQERSEKYYVRYPQSINDICREALYMQNCLLAYVEAIIENDTTILFMRKSDDINQPFITIEVCNMELMQAYHRFNEDCEPEEAEWIRNYCRRHNIGTSKFHFDAGVDELF